MQSENNQAQADKNTSFGNRLKAAREAMGLERKDVAAQLRLNEKFLVMMEKDRFSADLPLTFARGYLKTYAKFLQIPEFETKKALESLKPRPGTQDTFAPRNLPQITTGNYFMQLFSYLVVFTMVGLAGAWWYTHPNLPASILAENSFSFGKQTATPAKDAAPTPAHMANATQTPANMPIATETKAPNHTLTVTTDSGIDPIPAPGTTTATTTNDTAASDTETKNPAVANNANPAATATDADLDIAPPTTNPTPTGTAHAQAGKQTPAYMSGQSSDDPLEDKSNDTE